MQPAQNSYIDLMNTKRSTAAQSAKEQSELASMLAEMKKMQMASLMGQSKPSVVLTDQTDLGDKMKELTVKLVEIVKSTDTSQLTKDQTATIKSLAPTLDALRQLNETHNTITARDNQEIIKAIKALKLSTIVNVPDLPAPQVDLSSLETTMRELWEKPDLDLTSDEDKLDLDCYRAQDITDSGDMQYVGFVNPTGKWYIIENDVTANKMRYVFGNEGYSRAFSKASTYEYELLNEAVKRATA